MSTHRRTRKDDRFARPALGTAQTTFSFDELEDAGEETPMTAYVDVFDAHGRHSQTTTLLDPTSPVKAARREAAAQDPIAFPGRFLDSSHTEPANPDAELEESYSMRLWSNTDVLPEADPFETQAAEAPEPKEPKPRGRCNGSMEGESQGIFWRFFCGTMGVGSTGTTWVVASADSRSDPLSLVVWNSIPFIGLRFVWHVLRPALFGSRVSQLWTGTYFKRTALRSLGLRVQFGHPPRERCSNPHVGHSTFIVIHVNGIHHVAVDFCGCHLRRDAYHVQMLRRRWFPATMAQPRTAATFVALETLHALSLNGHLTTHKYYSALESLTDGSGVKPPYRYRELLRMNRQHRHLLLLKRAGRGHEPGGVDGTGIGELTVRCPACPRPGINLPNGWQNVSPQDQGLYIMYIAIDACFRLKRTMVSSVMRDPALGGGLAYFVEPEPYRKYLLTVTDQKEMSTCSGLAALDHANTKFSRGYSTTGVAMCICARHEFVLPNGVGDLQRGERYANVDYIYASAARHFSRLLRVMLSYDIACQWSKDLRKRLKHLPPLVRLYIARAFFGAMYRFVIPKMHIKGHILVCQLLFSLYLALAAGQLDGEGIERVWAMSGSLAGSTKMSGPGARSDQLDDHWGFWNWSKFVGLPALLRRRLDNARRELATQEAAFETFTEEQLVRAAEWKEMVAKFEAPRVEGEAEPPNPYETKVEGLTEAQVRKQFEADEAEEAAKGKLAIAVVSPSGFVSFGLDIEEQQRRIRISAELKKANSVAGQVDLDKARRKCGDDIKKLRSLQATYAPAALVRVREEERKDGERAREREAAILKRREAGEEVKDDDEQERSVEDVALFLPTALTSAERDAGCAKGLLEIEISMRRGQCRDALSAMRNQLHIKSRLLLYMLAHSRHQAMNTRSRTLVNRNESKLKSHTDKYQMSWAAVAAVLGPDGVGPGFRRLLKADIRCMEDPEALPAQKARELEKEKRRVAEEAKRIAMGEYPLVATERENWVEGDAQKDEGGTALEDAAGKKGKDKGKGHGESKRVLSWIWETTGIAGTEEELQDAIRVEWCRAYARVRRWREEVRITEEEWRRLPISLQHLADQWARRARATATTSGDAAVVEGRIAYAEKQRDLFLALILRAEEVRVAVKKKRKGGNTEEDADERPAEEDGPYDVEELEAAGHDSDSDDEA
ncbi:CxC2 domain-containing protein [Mycena chlorophos]|uniref:CxC2 domain-containing protein n=1 Tax=Mycena chlorophos TaxID=658473 RepID=A0A8H6WHX3_MYCCL|nr:CxC2 domain-containing protein [Mycena chlorophos]